MGLLPDYKFTIIADLPRISTLGSVGTDWTQSGSGATWANTAAGIAAVGSFTQTFDLQRPVTILAGKRYRVTMYATCLNNGTLSVFLGPNQNVYMLPIIGSTAPFIINFEFKGFANSAQFIHLLFFGTSPINFSFNSFSVQELDGLTRVVQPGGWKTLTKTSERTIEFWGIGESLEGGIELVGDDWDWLRSYLKGEPTKLFKCEVLIDEGAGLEPFYTGLLDTGSLTIVGITETYRMVVNFLRETEWSRLLSFADTKIALLANKGLHNLDVVDIRGSSETIAPASGFEPRLSYQFDGSTIPGQSYELTNTNFIQIGFGGTVRRNDGFTTFNGFGTQWSLQVDQGFIRTLVGTIQVNWSAPPSLFIEANLTGSAWVPLVNGGPPVAINITYSAGNLGFPVRARNTSGATNTIRVDLCTLIITASEIEFDIRPHAFKPLMVLKAFLGRVMGEYDNLYAGVFEDAIAAQAVADSTYTLQSPPLLYLSPADTQTYKAGNLYDGGDVSWVNASGPTRYSITLTGSQRSNLLLKRNNPTSGFTGGTTYFTKGDYTLTIGGASVTSGAGTLSLWGTIDQDLFLLADGIPLATGSYSITIDKLYDGVGLRLTASGGGVIFSITSFQMNYQAPATSNISRGTFANNFLTNGLALKTPWGAVPNISEPQEVNYGAVVRGLIKIFGIGMFPFSNDSVSSGNASVNNKLKIGFVPINDLFAIASGVTLYVNEFDIVLDSQIIKDSIPVGGPTRSKTKADQDSSCAHAEYASNYITQRSERNLEFDIVLNPAKILNQDVESDEIILFDMFRVALPLEIGVATTYRTTQGLTITGSPSPRQPNWLHSEGRLVRRNLGILSSMGSPFFRLIGGSASTQVRVNYSGDSLGTIADADVIFAAPLFTPWLIRFTTAITWTDYKTLSFNKYSQISLIINGISYAAFVKTLAYNPALGTLRAEAWLKTAGDFSSDFSDDFDNTAVESLGNFSDDFSDDFDNVAIEVPF